MVVERSEATDRGWDGHLLLLHGSESERVSGLVSWVRRGLANNEKVICGRALAEPEERSVEAILSSHGIDVYGLQAESRLAVVPVPDFFLPGGQLPVVEQALADGYRAARITCEAIAALTFLNWPAYMDVERGIGQVCQAGPLSALCQYQQASTTGARLRQITGSHLDGIRQRLLATGPERHGLALAGDVDISNETVLASILETAVARAGNTLHLELSRLEFLSVAGCRLLANRTRQFRDRGGQVLLIAPPSGVARVLRLSGLDRLPNVEVVMSRR